MPKNTKFRFQFLGGSSQEFSADCLSNAISLFQEHSDGSKEVEVIWMPNPDNPYDPEDFIPLAGSALLEWI